MDENVSWKIIYIATIFSLFILGLTYFLITPKESPYFTEKKMEKIAEFQDTSVSGRKDGQKTWVFFAQKGWTDRNNEITYLANVKDGEIFKQGKLIVTRLSCPWAKAYRSSEIVEAFGRTESQTQGPSQLFAYLELGRISHPKRNDPQDWTKMIADYLKYLPNEERSEIKGKVELFKKDSTIYANEILVNHRDNLADMSGEIKIQRKDGIFTSAKLKYFSNEEQLESSENVELKIRENKLRTNIKANQASFFMDMSRPMALTGNLQVAQGKKLAVADKGVYAQKDKELVLKGNVRTVFEKARVMIDEERAEKLRNPEAQDLLKGKTVLTADKLVYSTWNGDADASGNVVVTQKGNEAKSDRAVYDDQTDILTLTGNVSLKKSDKWVSARKVAVSVKDETFEAVGSVEAEFKL